MRKGLPRSRVRTWTHPADVPDSDEAVGVIEGVAVGPLEDKQFDPLEYME